MELTNCTRTISNAAWLALAGAAITVSPAAMASSFPPPGAGNNGAGNNNDADAPTTLQVYGLFRDFRAANAGPNGHPDFGVLMPDGNGVYLGMCADELNKYGNPVLASTGFKQTQSATDSNGNNIQPLCDYVDQWAGDTDAIQEGSEGQACQSAFSFAQWFRDDFTVNSTYAFPLTLNYDDATGMWVWDNDLRTEFASVPGFGGNKVFEYTFELELDFTYAAGDVFVVGADDCVWAYIDGKLVVDLGGQHAYEEQVIELDRLSWLTEGEKYRIKVFYAERQKGDSWLRLATTSVFEQVQLPPVNALWD